ncbi:MAG: amidohydrolase family protein [Acidimicrobiales bacterium]
MIDEAAVIDKGFEVFDADNHFYETTESFTRYLPERYRPAIRYVEVDGRTKLALRGRISEYIPNATFEVVASPGAWADYFRGVNPLGKTLRELAEPIRCRDEFRNPAKRLRLMDAQGVDAALMFPTLASVIEEHCRNDIELIHEAVHAFNRWILDEWTFDYQGRIFATPVVTLPIVDKAVEELEFLLEHGARTVLVRPAPVPTSSGPSVSPADRRFDPFWHLVQEAGIPVMMHASDSGYDRYVSDWEGGRDEFLPFEQTAFRIIVGEDFRPAYDTAASLVAHGLFTRFPGVRVAFVETGTAWVPRLQRNLARAYRKRPGDFVEDPVETFRRHFWHMPFAEEDMRAVVDYLPADRIVFGSDYPHPEGLADPRSFNDLLGEAGVGTDLVGKIMGGNLSTLMSPQPAAA